MVALGFHLRHGIWSALRRPSAASAAPRPRGPKPSRWCFAVVLTAGFLAVPVAVLTGLVS